MMLFVVILTCVTLLCFAVGVAVVLGRQGIPNKLSKEDKEMATVKMLTENEQVAKIGWGGSCKVSHDFRVKVGSNFLDVTGKNGRYEFTNKRGNYSGSITRRQILALADAIRDAGAPLLEQ